MWEAISQQIYQVFVKAQGSMMKYIGTNGSGYSRMDQVKFLEHSH